MHTRSLSRSDFPDAFLWGAATSAHQIEGDNIHSDWWAWELAGRTETQERSGKATGHRTRFQEDLKAAQGLGLNSYRFSIEWSRIEPQPGVIDREALQWYARLLDTCEAQNLQPMATLHHFTSPKWFADAGGFARPGASETFLKFVKLVVEELGPRIPLWCTLNEPNVLTIGTYLGGFMPPGRVDGKAAAIAQQELLRSHALAYDCIHSSSRRTGPWAHVARQVGLALNMMDFLPARSWNFLERILVSRIHRFYNLAWLEAVTGGRQDFGLLHLIPRSRRVPEAHGRRTVDFLGVNYYTKGIVRLFPPAGNEGLPGTPVALTFAASGDRVSDMGWAIHPEGFRKILKLVAGYGLPIHITENGVADAQDLVRTEFIQRHLHVIRECLGDGIPIESYYYWSLLDNFEWAKGFGPRFGILKVDYTTLEREVTGTAQWLKKFLAHPRGLEPLTLRSEV